jgi:hypothetical protein
MWCGCSVFSGAEKHAKDFNFIFRVSPSGGEFAVFFSSGGVFGRIMSYKSESGQRATGSFHGKWDISTNWQGTRINGTVTRDGDGINWDNGTYWIRLRLYTQLR